MKDIKLTNEELCYIAGFLDGDGSVFAQIIPDSSYKFGFRIRTSMGYYQKKDKHWFLIQLQKKLDGHGYIRIKPDGMGELIITATEPLTLMLNKLEPYVILKKPIVNLVLEIIEDKKQVKSADDFIRVCKKVDKTALLIYSKTRKYTSETVEAYLRNNNYFDN
jgi:hypothetical protein